MTQHNTRKAASSDANHASCPPSPSENQNGREREYLDLICSSCLKQCRASGWLIAAVIDSGPLSEVAVGDRRFNIEKS